MAVLDKEGISTPTFCPPYEQQVGEVTLTITCCNTLEG